MTTWIAALCQIVIYFVPLYAQRCYIYITGLIYYIHCTAINVILADNVFTEHPVGRMQRILCVHILINTVYFIWINMKMNTYLCMIPHGGEEVCVWAPPRTRFESVPWYWLVTFEHAWKNFFSDCSVRFAQNNLILLKYKTMNHSLPMIYLDYYCEELVCFWLLTHHSHKVTELCIS